MKTIMLIGNAHIDPVWFWRWQDGYHEVMATFRAALDRLNEFPGFVFTCACADYYRWVEQNNPDLFAEISARVAQGRWAIVGGMWIQPDMNTPSGESLARQLLYSQQYFQKKFGKIARIGYNVDSFGHNAMFPQLLRKSSMEGYVWMRPSCQENPDIPEGAMWWESPDGSRVPAYRIEGEYTGAHELPAKIARMFAFAEKIHHPVMCFYGVGNHGGGPTIENLRQIEAIMTGGERGDELAYASPEDYFAQLRECDGDLPVWRGELQHHASGCYSTHSLSKRKHRMVENALLRMEKFSALAQRLSSHALNMPFVRQAWQNLMFNEFHDILGGCCIPEAMDDAIMQLDEALSIAAREENAALQRISWRVDTIKGHPARVRSKEESWMFWGIRGQGTPVVVFNPHPFAAEGEVLLHQPLHAVRDDEGHPIPAQIVRASRTNGHDLWDGIFRAAVPPMGYRLYWVFLENAAPVETELRASATSLENAFLRAEFDPATGALRHLIDKRSGIDTLSGPVCARLLDISHCDTWAHNIFQFDLNAGTFAEASVSLLESGPVRAILQVTTRYGQSELQQRYILYAEADQLQVDVCLNLHERHRMIKLCFPTAFREGFDVAEISFGALERSANGNEEHCQGWAALQGNAGGLAILNNGKYSYSAKNGELRLTIANTSIFADHYGQQTRDASCRFLDQGEQRFSYALVPFAGSWRDAALARRASLFNQPLTAVVETYHEGPLGSAYSGLSLDNPKILLSAIKRAENGRGWILRACETTGEAQHVRLAMPMFGRECTLDFGAFEIKTLFLPDDSALPIVHTLLTELDLD